MKAQLLLVLITLGIISSANALFHICCQDKDWDVSLTPCTSVVGSSGQTWKNFELDNDLELEDLYQAVATEALDMTRTGLKEDIYESIRLKKVLAEYLAKAIPKDLTAVSNKILATKSVAPDRILQRCTDLNAPDFFACCSKNKEKLKNIKVHYPPVYGAFAVNYITIQAETFEFNRLSRKINLDEGCNFPLYDDFWKNVIHSHKELKEFNKIFDSKYSKLSSIPKLVTAAKSTLNDLCMKQNLQSCCKCGRENVSKYSGPCQEKYAAPHTYQITTLGHLSCLKEVCRTFYETKSSKNRFLVMTALPKSEPTSVIEADAITDKFEYKLIPVELNKDIPDVATFLAQFKPEFA